MPSAAVALRNATPVIDRAGVSPLPADTASIHRRTTALRARTTAWLAGRATFGRRMVNHG